MKKIKTIFGKLGSHISREDYALYADRVSKRFLDLSTLTMTLLYSKKGCVSVRSGTQVRAVLSQSFANVS